MALSPPRGNIDVVASLCSRRAQFWALGLGRSSGVVGWGQRPGFLPHYNPDPGDDGNMQQRICGTRPTTVEMLCSGQTDAGHPPARRFATCAAALALIP